MEFSVLIPVDVGNSYFTLPTSQKVRYLLNFHNLDLSDKCITQCFSGSL